MTTSIYRRVLAVLLLAALVIPFQNCGEKADLGGYVNNSSTTATAVPKVPVIVSSSSPGKVAVFQSTALSVVAAGETPLTYQWYKDNQPLANETNPILVIVEPTGATPTTVTTSYLYKVVVKDKDGEPVEQELPLIVERSTAQEAAAPAISGFTVNGVTMTSYARPNCNTNANQSNFTIGVTATGTRLRYTWKVTYPRNNGAFYTDVLSTDAAVLTPPIYPIFDFNTGVYYCRVIFGGTYNVVVTDAFGRSTTRDFVVN